MNRQKANKAQHKEAGGLDKGGSKKRDQDFARHVLEACESAQRGDGPPADAPPDAVRLATALVFIAAQAEEFFRTCPLQNDPRIAVSLYVKQLVADIITRRRHPIEMFFSGLGGAKPYTSRIPSQDNHNRFVLAACVHAILCLISTNSSATPNVQAAVDRVWKNPEIRNFCSTEEILKHWYRNALLENRPRVESTTNNFLSRSYMPDDIIELSLRLLYFNNQPMGPAGAKTVRTHRAYYRLEQDGSVTWELPPDAPLRGHILQSAVQALAEQGGADTSGAEGP